ncbi:hypothetical protein GGX14DRAFT_353768 [Mycena pura]|uniref:Cytochrome P450 n=1 Tax=Mycena pura TaxID=153505 RepID=A0AAD6YHA9_9AGAR|nr:hypothetical protein GGX14DRAFT_353768 [Mycena pura]
MHNIFELYGICICMAIFTFLILSHFHILPSRRTTVHHTLPGVRAVLDPPAVSKSALLRSRASPNTRLVKAFHLTNTFVRDDLDTHSEFLHRTKDLLDAARSSWLRFAEIATDAVTLSLPDSSTDFRTFVHAVTLRAIIGGLLDPTADMTLLDSNDIRVVAELITDVWLLSKKPDPIPAHLLQALQERLRRLVPDHDLYPNPLDFVIPTWETFWRVVAVILAHVENDAEASRAFLDFFENPSSEQFRATTFNDAAPSVRHYVIEAMRLHPPVRHISRHIFESSRLTAFVPGFLAGYLSPRVHIAVADIESAQRSVHWAPDPDVYDPARFVREPDRARDRDMLAFGYGPLRCIAAEWAPMAAAAVVAAVLNRVDGVGYRFVRGPRIGGREGWDGWVVCKVD